KFGGFHFDERCIGKLGQTPGDFSFTHPGGADHEDIFGGNFAAQRLFQLHASPAVAQCDGNGALGSLLPNDVLVQFVDDFAGGDFGHSTSNSVVKIRRLGGTSHRAESAELFNGEVVVGVNTNV